MRGKCDQEGHPKVLRAEGFKAVEKIDLLLLTETHMDAGVSPPASQMNVLAHSGVSSLRVGLTLLSLKNSGWSCTESIVLVPGYVMLLLITN